MLALCQLVTVPYVLSRGKFTFVSNLYMGIVLVLCVLSLVLNITFYGRMIKEIAHKFRECPWTVWVAVALIALQTIVSAAGRHVDDDDAWERIKDGTYTMFSIEGRGEREPVQKSAKSFDDIVRNGK